MAHISCPSCGRRLESYLIDIVVQGGELSGSGGIQCDCGFKIRHSEITVLAGGGSDENRRLWELIDKSEARDKAVTVLLRLGVCVAVPVCVATLVYALWWGGLSSWSVFPRLLLTLVPSLLGAHMVIGVFVDDAPAAVDKTLASGWISSTVLTEIWLLYLVFWHLAESWVLPLQVLVRVGAALLISVVVILVGFGLVSWSYPPWLDTKPEPSK